MTPAIKPRLRAASPTRQGRRSRHHDPPDDPEAVEASGGTRQQAEGHWPVHFRGLHPERAGDSAGNAATAAGQEAYMVRRRVVIMGAAGRDFHDFNVLYRNDPDVEVVAFTATQIPGIADRRYPAALAGI